MYIRVHSPLVVAVHAAVARTDRLKQTETAKVRHVRQNDKGVKYANVNTTRSLTRVHVVLKSRNLSTRIVNFKRPS